MYHIDLFYEHRKAEGLSPRTIQWYRKHIQEFLMTMQVWELEDWTALNVTRFLAMKRETCNHTSMHMYWRTITFASRWLYLQRYLDEDITPRIPKPRQHYEPKEGFSPDEVRAMLDVGRRSYRPLFTRALILLLYDTGIRSGELRSLRAHQLDVTGQQIHVRGKTGDRVVPAGRRALRACQQYRTRERRASPQVEELFVTRKGRPLTSLYVTKKVRFLARQAGIERDYIGPHAFRHGFALQYLRNGGDVIHLRQVLGHKSIEMTERYLRLLPVDLQEHHTRFSPAEQL